MNAFLYLVWTSWRNRVVTLVRKARSPRQIVALAVGAAYLWWFLVRPIGRGGPGVGSIFGGLPFEMIATLLLTLTLLSAWVFGSDTLALAFTQAEVSFLFPGPLSRRGLIGYKLFRAQLPVVINALIWVFILRRGGTAIPSPLRAISLWVLFSTLNLHRLGAALIWSSWREHGRAGMKRNRTAIAIFSLMGIALVAGFVIHRAEFANADRIGAFFRALAHTLSTVPAIIALFPMHIIVGPAFATSVGEWARAMVPALALLGLHAFWVIRNDTAFEDAAIEASNERARRRAAGGRRGLAAPRAPRATGSIQLGATGHPAMAIIWKNLLCLRRTAQVRLLIAPMFMAIAIGAAVSSSRVGNLATTVAISALTMAALLLTFGSRFIRNDLRHDMLHLPLLKSSPLAPADIVLAEVASAALPVAAIQLVLLIIAYVAGAVMPEQPLALSTRVALLVAAPFAVIALNGALLTVQNGAAVLFPTWIRLGPAVSTGVEALGQNLLSTVANVLGLVLGLAVPVLIAWTTVATVGAPKAVALALVIVVCAVVLAGETYLVIRYLGGALARAEPVASE